jgi:hypothetical protein
MTDVEGLPRSYFYRRLAYAMHKIIERDIAQEGSTPEMADRVDVQEALNRLVTCPICSRELMTYPNYPHERVCGSCGEFTIAAVWLNGDVEFTFKMLGAPAAEEAFGQAIQQMQSVTEEEHGDHGTLAG